MRLVCKAHVSLNSSFESNEEEEEKTVRVGGRARAESARSLRLSFITLQPIVE